jgi:proteasome lid subunit RPN8/RPN11
VGSQAVFDTNLLEVIRAEGVVNFPNESCGLIIAKGKKSVVVVCQNISEHPRNQFLISAESQASAAEQGEIIGVWHTHINIPAVASEADRAGCELTGVPWFIVAIYQNEIGEFSFSALTIVEPTGFEMPYIGRPYVFGVFDCWSLVRDYYKREYAVDLSFGPRIPNFWESDDLLGKSWQGEGFISLIDQEAKPGDVFLIQMTDSKNCSHVAVYVGEGRILHHSSGRLSNEENYCGRWLNRTTLHLRHQTKC